MKLVILTTSKSISITDDVGNKIIIVKANDGIQLHSSIEQSGKAKGMLELQRKLTAIIKNPKSNKTNYAVRFEKLAKALTEINTSTFRTVLNGVDKIEQI